MSKYLFASLIVSVLMTACGIPKASVDGNTGASQPHRSALPVDGSATTLSHAIIYKMSGDYADNVPVGYNSRTGQVVRYPAPSDLSGSAPVKLRDGYYLDRRGVGSNTAFTRYTYDEYMAMKTAPTTARLKDAIIYGARVTELVEMPFTYSPGCEAMCDSLISLGLPGCKIVFKAPTHSVSE